MAEQNSPGAARLRVMLNHSTHLLFALLWLVAQGHAVRRIPRSPVELLLGLAEAGVYLAGLVVRRRPSTGSRRVGHVWVATLVAVWAALCACSVDWLWLGFPLYFLVFYIVASPASWVLVVAMTLWEVASTPVRGEGLGTAQLLGPLLGLLVAAISWVVLQQLRRDVREQQRLTAELAGAQQRLVDAAAERARDQERQQIARDLHDTLAQGLNSIVMLSRAAGVRHPELADDLGLIESTARSNLDHARAMVRDIAAAPDGSGAAADGSGTPDGARGTLAEQVREVVSAQAARERMIGSHLDIEFVADGTSRSPDAAVVHAVVMACRSLLANVVQHAAASRCRVSLTWHDTQVSLDVVDDGVGFDPDTGSGFGLAALRARVDELGGGVAISSAPGDGCSVGLTLPLHTTWGGASTRAGREQSHGA